MQNALTELCLCYLARTIHWSSFDSTSSDYDDRDTSQRPMFPCYSSMHSSWDLEMYSAIAIALTTRKPSAVPDRYSTDIRNNFVMLPRRCPLAY